jgi:hypothetical protein
MAKAPQHLVFDSKLTTYPGLDRLDAAISFLTLRRRSPKLLAEAANLPMAAARELARVYAAARLFLNFFQPSQVDSEEP